MNPPYCDFCERAFIDEGALLMHVRNSKVHKKEVKKQRTSVQRTGVKIAPPPALSTGAPRSGLHSQQDRTSTSLQFQNNTITAIDLSTDLQQRMVITDENSSPSMLQNIASSNERFQHGGNRWTVISALRQSTMLEVLSSHCHSPEDLLKNSYLLCPRSADDIAGYRRCKNCGGLQKNIQNRAQTDCIFHPGKQQKPSEGDQRRPYSCCERTDRGCTSLPTHNFASADRRLVVKNQELAATPSALLWNPKRRAVALDCEMAGVQGAASELILICAVDYLTGETLMNTFVRPTKRVVDWRTRVSGVTAEDMAAAVARGLALAGWKEARAELWKHIDANTVLVGQSLQNDLDALRMVHTRVVDSAILARNAVGLNSRQWGLKSLCSSLLGIEVQGNGRKGHDCMEDALAAREVVLWCTQMPDALRAWGEDMREAEEKRIAVMREKNAQKKSEEQKGQEENKKMGARKEGSKQGPETQNDPSSKVSESKPVTTTSQVHIYKHIQRAGLFHLTPTSHPPASVGRLPRGSNSTAPRTPSAQFTG